MNVANAHFRIEPCSSCPIAVVDVGGMTLFLRPVERVGRVILADKSRN